MRAAPFAVPCASGSNVMSEARAATSLATFQASGLARPQPAAIAQPKPDELMLSGSWTALGIGALEKQVDEIPVVGNKEIAVDGAAVEALDTVGVWVLQHLQQRLHDAG